MNNIDWATLDSDGWVDVLPAYQKDAIQELFSGGKTEVEVAQIWLDQIGPDTNIGFGASSGLKTYFSNFQTEIDELICGKEKYKKERLEAIEIWKKHGKLGMVSFVAGVIATQIGLAAVTLIPVVSLFLTFVGKAGVNAYCATKRGGNTRV